MLKGAILRKSVIFTLQTCPQVHFLIRKARQLSDFAVVIVTNASPFKKMLRKTIELKNAKYSTSDTKIIIHEPAPIYS